MAVNSTAIKKISFENFTVFEKMDILVCDGVNVFIGGNGTGKTHLLKVLYAWCESELGNVSEIADGAEAARMFHEQLMDSTFVQKIARCFRDNDVKDHNDRVYGKLIKKRSYSAGKTVFARTSITTSDDKNYSSQIQASVTPSGIVPNTVSGASGYHHPSEACDKKPITAVFIPAKEMLTHSGLEKDYTQRNLPFDITLIDILNKAGVSTLKNLSAEMHSILERIEHIIGGKVLFENNRYSIQKESGARIDFSVEAEGFKKLALIYRLIETGNIAKGSVLIWDEPESNINPQNIPVIVDILLELQKIGVQIFVATHNYFLAKYFNVKKTKCNNVLFHALYKSGDEVFHESNSDYSMLENDNIVKQSIELYKEEVKKVME